MGSSQEDLRPFPKEARLEIGLASIVRNGAVSTPLDVDIVIRPHSKSGSVHRGTVRIVEEGIA